MPKRSERLFEYRGQWITRDPERDGFYRNWYDKQRGRVKRKKLTSIDLQQACDQLISILSTANRTAKDPSRVLLADVLAHYIQFHCMPKGPSATANARRAAQLCMSAIGEHIDHPTVADLTRLRQRQVWKWMADQKPRPLTPKSIMTYMISIRAAINFASKPQIVIIECEDEQEIQLLDAPITVFCNEAEISSVTGRPVSTARHWIPTFEQFGKWLDVIDVEDDFRCIIIALNTWARNEAVFDLRVSKQVDFEFDTIDLNPAGRNQTKKRRPVIRLTPGLSDWLRHWKMDRPITHHRDRIEKRINRRGKLLGMPEFTLYTIRHFMATQSRRTTFPVSREQRSLWLGHTIKQGSSTTEWYESFDPDYLEEPMLATQEIVEKLDGFTEISLLIESGKPKGSIGRLSA